MARPIRNRPGGINTAKLIKSLEYPPGRDIWYHPRTDEDFSRLMDQMVKANNIDDSNGVFTLAMQLIPRVLITGGA